MHERNHRLTLLARVVGTLQEAGAAHALIGAAALAGRGVSRSTQDVDLLVVDPRCLSVRFWEGLKREGASVDVRRGDDDDPLAGVVAFAAEGERPVDLVVGKRAWQGALLTRAEPSRFSGVLLPVVRTADLVLLKLFAGGPQDAWDIAELLAVSDRPALKAEVESRLAELPAPAGTLWRKIEGESGS